MIGMMVAVKGMLSRMEEAIPETQRIIRMATERRDSEGEARMTLATP